MTRLGWITDPHLNFLRAPEAVKRFGEYLAAEHDFDAVVITGDIAEAPTVKDLLTQFVSGLRKPVYFVLGNHDYYRGSIAGVEADLAGANLHPNLVWLEKLDTPVLLDVETALVGQAGWYDGRLGDADKSRVLMTDFELIQDFRTLYSEKVWLYEGGGRVELLTKLRTLSAQHAEAARNKLLRALVARKNVIFVTHYPPFKDACWHQGGLSDPHWMPWFTSMAMGEMLAEVAEAHPDNRILVLCGHTHSHGVYQHSPNLMVITGQAEYGAPDVAGLFVTPLGDWADPERCDRCDDTDFEVSATIITCNTCSRTWGRVNDTWVLDPAS